MLLLLSHYTLSYFILCYIIPVDTKINIKWLTCIHVLRINSRHCHRSSVSSFSKASIIFSGKTNVSVISYLDVNMTWHSNKLWVVQINSGHILLASIKNDICLFLGKRPSQFIVYTGWNMDYFNNLQQCLPLQYISFISNNNIKLITGWLRNGSSKIF